ncbi:MAG TPA: hypothetical protein VGS22_25705 [Thermoanaerobaculia bacterium]|jgi:hypothetical protein|nr:hypothetical protein [Thermoanaerobaculia bacterium]
MTRGKWVLVGLAGLAAVAGHVGYWYWPRERSAVPDAADVPARMVAAGAWDACLWIPYPHQNLGALAEELDDAQSYFAAVARLSGSAEPSMPAFGPFAVPPARELAACADRNKERLRVSARVYPGLALVAKLAGRVAGNPWLAGGGVKVSDRPATVAWEGTLWTVEVGAPVAIPEAGWAPEAPVLGAFHLVRSVENFPSGIYALGHRDDAIDLTLEGSRFPKESPFDPNELATDRPILLVVAGAEGKNPAAALAFYDGKGSLGLPSGVLFHPPKRARWDLPGGGIGGLLADRLPHGAAAGWEMVALDEKSLDRGEALAPAVARIAPPEGEPRPGPRVRMAVWLVPEPALGVVARMRAGLEKFPLALPSDIQPWRDWETVLTPAARCEKAALWSTAEPQAFRVRLSGCS